MPEKKFKIRMFVFIRHPVEYLKIHGILHYFWELIRKI